jgi:hypothetical protein
LIDLGEEFDALARDIGLDPGDGLGHRNGAPHADDTVVVGSCGQARGACQQQQQQKRSADVRQISSHSAGHEGLLQV